MAAASGATKISKAGFDVTPMSAADLEAAKARLSDMEQHVNFKHGTGEPRVR